MPILTNRVMPIMSLVFAGGIFGFFYAWVCSTMWGLDAIDPRVAIRAMQGMNASVRNGVFFPAFFLTPVVLGLTAVLLRISGQWRAALWFGAGALIYLCGGLILTASINVPMNEALAKLAVPDDIDAAREIWAGYSQPWQVYNITRTLFSGLALVLAGIGTLAVRR